MSFRQSSGLFQELRWNMTPALWRAIGLLRMDAGELSRFAETQAEGNPFLKVKSAPRAGRPKSERAPGGYDTDGLAARPDTLHTVVARQIEEIDWPDTDDKAVAYRYLEALEPWGWVSTEVEQVAELMRVGPQRAARVLARLQRLDPPGIFARGLTECLALQLEERGQLGPHEKAVLELLKTETDISPSALASKCGISREDVTAVLARLRRLDPKPGAAFAHDPTVDVTPDVVVTMQGDGWRVELNNSELPSVTVDHAMMESVRKRRSGADRREFRHAYGAARWLAEAIARRNQTVLDIASEVVLRQSAFVTRGSAALLPLSQREIARHLLMSESSVSRVVGSSWAQLPRGVVSMRDFFATTVPTSEGTAAVSAPSVRNMIARHIGTEDPLRPLSDERIKDWLAERGVLLSRRAVAKYRSAIGIPDCRARRRRMVSGAPD